MGSARSRSSGSRVTSRRVGILPDHPERMHPHHVAALPKVPRSRSAFANSFRQDSTRSGSSPIGIADAQP